MAVSAAKLSLTWKPAEHTSPQSVTIKHITNEETSSVSLWCLLQLQVLPNYSRKLLSKLVFSDITCKHVVSQILPSYLSNQKEKQTPLQFVFSPLRMG